jgi:DNA-binding MarR family transcriptional regulator
MSYALGGRPTRRSGSEFHVTLPAERTHFHNGLMHKEVMDSADSGEELLLVIEQLVRFIRQVATAGELSMTASSTLSRLRREGPQRLTELAHAEGVSQPAMTQLVTRMEREGLVCRTASTDDRRGVLVEATDAGMDLVSRGRAERAGALQQMIDRLDPQDQAAVVAALPALARLIETRASA